MQNLSPTPSPASRDGGAREMLHLAWPLIVSSSFSTVQITVDRIFAARLSSDAASAVTNGAMFFWTLFIIPFCAVGYVSTFVAQYTGAGRPQRIGPVVWQAIYLGAFAGIALLALIPLAATIFAWSEHSPAIQAMEVDYFRAICWMGLPALLTAVASGFFSGRGETRTVIWINLAGTVANALLNYAWVFGHWGFPAFGVRGSAWATAAASCCSALLGMGLMFRRPHRTQYRLLTGYHFEWPTFRRLVLYGGPSGTQWFLDMTAFTAFLFLMGRFGDVENASSSLAYTINNFAYIPMIGLGQAVSVLVGRRLGEDRPEVAARSVRSAFLISTLYMCSTASCYLLFPDLCAAPFENSEEPAKWAAISAQLKVLFYFIAAFAFFDSMTLMFSSALRGAGDTLYVTLVSLTLAWPIMVLPTWLCWHYDWGLLWAWAFLSLFIAAQGLFYWLRFRGGKWKAMRVIEEGPQEEVEF